MQPSAPTQSSQCGLGTRLHPSSPGAHLRGVSWREARLWKRISRGRWLRERCLLEPSHGAHVVRFPDSFPGLLWPVKWCPWGPTYGGGCSGALQATRLPPGWKISEKCPGARTPRKVLPSHPHDQGRQPGSHPRITLHPYQSAYSHRPLSLAAAPQSASWRFQVTLFTSALARSRGF